MGRWLDYLGLLKIEPYPAWTIGVYSGVDPLNLSPHPLLGNGVVLTPKSLSNIAAYGVADPFMVRFGDEWMMFFEIENRLTGKGEIGLAVSRNALSWDFKGVVLEEPFHLSYPHVFEHDGSYYMIPESAAAGGVRLYKADPFPAQWKLVGELIHGDLADATTFRHGDHWWIMAQQGFHRSDEFVLYFADRLEGPWHAHPKNPIYKNNRKISRPAGRVIEHGGRLIRFAQDGEKNYGRSVRAFSVEELTTTSYVEHPICEAPILGATGHGWNASGMHHIDLHQLGAGDWIACVSGRRPAWRLPIYERVIQRLSRFQKQRR